MKCQEFESQRNKNDWLARNVIIPVSIVSHFKTFSNENILKPPNTKILFTQFLPCQNGKTDIWIEFDLRIWISISTWYLTILRPANWLSWGFCFRISHLIQSSDSVMFCSIFNQLTYHSWKITFAYVDMLFVMVWDAFSN